MGRLRETRGNAAGQRVKMGNSVPSKYRASCAQPLKRITEIGWGFPLERPPTTPSGILIPNCSRGAGTLALRLF